MWASDIKQRWGPWMEIPKLGTNNRKGSLLRIKKELLKQNSYADIYTISLNNLITEQ